MLDTFHSTTNQALRLSLPCDIDQVRPFSRSAREFLAENGVSEEELMSCELALVEACNNAIAYALPSRKLDPIEIELHCSNSEIVMRVHDHTAGFEWPQEIVLAGERSESGRGLFIIQSLMNKVSYRGSVGENTLTMKKIRSRSTADNSSEAEFDAKLQLAESEQIINEMAEELSSCYESLSAIFRSGTELGKTHNFKNFCHSLCDDLVKITSSDWYLLRIVPATANTLSTFASSNDHQPAPLNVDLSQSAPSVELQAAAQHKDILFGAQNRLAAEDPLHTMPDANAGLVHPFYFAETLIGTLTIGKTFNARPFTAAQVNVVHTLADFLAIQIVNARLHEEQLGHRLVTRELEIAREIQRALLPKKLPQPRGFSLAGFCQSARHVGGDFYDVVPIDDHCALLMIADVMGKGVPAAMFAATLRSVLRGIPELMHRPAALLSRANELLHEDLSDVDMFITAQIAFVDGENRKLILASAGHCPALLFSDATSEPKLLSPEGMPLGILRNTAFTEVTETLSRHSRLVLHTDGITESRNPNGEFFGTQRITDWMRRAGSFPGAEELKESLALDLNNFQSHAALNDDQTFLILAGKEF